MYTIQQGIATIASNPTGIVIAAFITYGFGFLQYGTSMYMQVKNKSCPFYFWMHVWYFGHDFTFAFICYKMWFNTVHWWLFEMLCIGCMMFVCIEIFSIYRAIRYERQEIWGKYIGGKEVTVKYAVVRGVLGYALGVVLFATLRYMIGDPFCLFLMMSTNAILAMNVHRRFDEYGVSLPGAKFLTWMTLFGTIFTFIPKGIGFFATFVPPLQNWSFTLVGVICVLCSIRAIYQSNTLPQADKLPEVKPIPAQTPERTAA